MEQVKDDKHAGWLNRTVLGIGAASFLSDVSHETATSLLPLLAGQMGHPAALLGAVEGLSDAASGAAKLWSGWASDRQRRRKPMAVAGYVLSALATGTLGAATAGWQVVTARTIAWVGRGVRSPARQALLAGDVDAAHYGKAFGFERALDTLGAVMGPLAVAALVATVAFRTLLWWTVLPGLLAALAMTLLVREKERPQVSSRPFLGALAELPPSFRRYLTAVGVFGIGDFAHSLLILRATDVLEPSMGPGGGGGKKIGLYAVHNIAGALLAFFFGAAGDRFGRMRTLSFAYLLGAAMVVLLMVPPTGRAGADTLALGAVFVLAGAMRAGESALETAVAASLLEPARRGTGFGALAAVNSACDLVSSLFVGILWQTLGPAVAFAAAAAPMLTGALLVNRAARGAARGSGRRPG